MNRPSNLEPRTSNLSRTVLCILLALVSSAHVGSPNVFFDGMAGAYPVRVVVRPPQVIPGLAEITVRITGGNPADVRRVVVRPVYWSTGTAGSPRGDEAVRVQGPDPLYQGNLWFMRPGSYSVHVTVEGTRGTGTVTVPVGAVATAQISLSGGLRATLIVLGVGLFAGLITLLHAALSESVTAPGAPVDPRRRRRARVVTAAAVPALALAVLGGARWWDAEAAAYRRTLYRPLDVRASVSNDRSGPTLELTIVDSAWLERRITPVIPDHGKLMHMFLIRDTSLNVFAHLHPAMRDSNTFVTPLPPLPEGRYRVYGDIVHESGFERTLVASVHIPRIAPSAWPVLESRLDRDDAWHVELGPSIPAPPVEGSIPGAVGESWDYWRGPRRTEPEPVLAMFWLDGTKPLVAGRETTLRFTVRHPLGNPVVLEPYMGMPGHAVVTREDGSVFIHLHPMGTVKLAAQQAFALRDRGDTTPDGRVRLTDTATARQPGHAGHDIREVSFPYEFPKPGNYRIWVQVKHDGRVLTRSFAATVRE